MEPYHYGSLSFARVALENFRTGDSNTQGDLKGKMVLLENLEDNQGTRVVFEDNLRYCGIQNVAWLMY